MSSARIQPSPPPSPTEEDISRAALYNELQASASTTSLTSSDKGKQKQKAEDPFDDDGNGSLSEDDTSKRGSYPPVNDEEAETRRVEENLRKWEQAERQRRKAARESSSTVASSLVGDVARKASSLWPSRRRSKQASQGGIGTHHIVPTTDDAVHMDDIENDTTIPVTPDPTVNPFITPRTSTISLNTPQDSAIMMETSESQAQDLTETTLKRGKSLNRHPPPQPLDIPPPRTPPPPSGAPVANRAPEPISPPIIAPQTSEEDLPEKRWWTDWVCGCRERNDEQAGRTNPFE